MEVKFPVRSSIPRGSFLAEFSTGLNNWLFGLVSFEILEGTTYERKNYREKARSRRLWVIFLSA